jgi:RNA polymerase sigma-70 factor (ECF subfamily)
MQQMAHRRRVKGVSTISDLPRTDAAIYRRNRDDLVRFASALVGRDEAPDVLSTVMVRVLNRRHLTDLEDPRAYLFRAVLNESRSFHRRRRPMPLTADVADPGNGAPRPEVIDAVRRLPPRQRAATFLVYWMGCSIAETAELMGARPGTVSRYLHLARNRLRSCLDED